MRFLKLILIAWLIMSELIIYTCSFKNNEGCMVTVTLQDLTNYDPTNIPPDVRNYTLQGGASPFKTECFDLGISEVLGYGIMGTQATFSFKSTAEIGIKNFSRGSDRSILMIVGIDHPTLGTMAIFQGYVLQDGNTEGYVPPGQDVFIRATCGLGTLDGAEIRNIDGTIPNSEVPLTKIQWLVMALKNTGLDLRINVVDNLFNALHQYRSTGGFEANSPWNQTYILPSSYEQEVNEFKNSKDVVLDLLNGMLRISQYNGEWWAIRVAECKLPTISYTQFLPDTGAVQAGVMDYAGHKVNIGHARFETTYFINRESAIEILRPAKSAAAIFRFEIPKELPRNKDFIRGARKPTADTPGYQGFEIDDWHAFRISGDGVPSAGSYIRRKFDDLGYEIERYLVINPSDFSAIPKIDNVVAAKAIYMKAGDKCKFSIDRRTNADVSGGDYTDTIAQIRFYADDDTYYTLHGGTITDPKVRWEQCTVSFSTNQKVIAMQGNSANDDWREWKNKTVEAAPAPKTGRAFILLFQSPLRGATLETHFSNLEFTLIPIENGNYKKFYGEKITNTQLPNGVSGRNEFTLKKEFTLSNCESSHVVYKGALLNYNSYLQVATVLSNRWFDWSLYHAGAPYDALHPIDKFLKHASLDFYDHYRISRPALSFTLKKLLHENGYCAIHHIYLNSVNSDHTKNKMGMCTSMVQDWMACVMTGNMIPINDTTDEYAAADEFTSERKFIES